jgi:phage tail sheath protein FI
MIRCGRQQPAAASEGNVPEYLAPGVYVEEVSGAARPIQAVGTSTACFFGVASESTIAPRTPTFVTNAAEYDRVFGNAGGTLANAVHGFFQNGGGRCYVVDIGAGRASLGADDVALIDPVDGINLIAAPGYTDAASYATLIAHCEAHDRFAILDTLQDIDPLERLTRPMGDGDGLHPPTAPRGHAAVYVPWIEIADAATRERVMQPPSGHIAGVYARIDAERGVHKAPANVGLFGVVGLARNISSYPPLSRTCSTRPVSIASACSMTASGSGGRARSPVRKASGSTFQSAAL